MEKNDYHHGNLKEEFLQIAFKFINKEDTDKLTLKVLSDATGTSRSTIYRHFKNKDALIDGFLDVEEIYDDLFERLFKSLLDSNIVNKVKVLSTLPLLNKILEPSK